MKSLLMHFYFIIVRVVPSMRLFRFRNLLLNALGFRIDMTARLVSSVKVSGPCELVVGKSTFIGHDVGFYGNGSFYIGNDVDVAPRVMFLSGSHYIDMMPSKAAGTGFSGEVVVNDGAWIGAGCIIMPGVKIGRSAIVAAGSVVTGHVNDYCLYAGVPAVCKRKLIDE